MADLKPIDLGKGYQLVFQRSTANYNVRAVVKNSSGDIIIRGPVVSESQAEISKRSAASEFLASNLHVPSPPPDEDLDDEELTAEDDEDEDEEDGYL